MELLYKYRSLENLERFLDIIIDKKLYGALYKELNDPMEGYFQYNPNVDRKLVHSIWEGKERHYICSLSRYRDIGLMWTHYANENKGCCIEVEVTTKTWQRLEVEYCSQVPILTNNTGIEDILKVKAKMWEYENEVRYLSPAVANKGKRLHLAVRINKVYLGYKVNKRKFNHLKKIINALNSNIEVVKMKKDILKYGFV